MFWAAQTSGRFDRWVSDADAAIPVEFDRTAVVDQIP
jgi:hypothetical protein